MSEIIVTFFVPVPAAPGTQPMPDRSVPESRKVGFGVGVGFFSEPSLQSFGHQLDAGEVLADTIVQVLAEAALFGFADLQDPAFEPLALGDVGADGHVLDRFARRVYEGEDGGVDPIK